MRAALLVILGLMCGGCLLDLLGSMAIESELQAKQLQTLDKAKDFSKDSTAVITVQQAINAYAAEKGSYPPSLEVLVPEWLPSIPTAAHGMPLVYDPATGRVSEGPDLPSEVAPPTPTQPVKVDEQAAKAAQADQMKLEEVRRAINRYGQTTGYFPASLAALVPYYLAEVPQSTSGQEFLYDPQSGTLALPPEVTDTPAAEQQMAQPVPSPGAKAPAVAGGPLGETMTGIGIQNELNGMSNAGTSEAGSRLRQQAKGLGSNQQDAAIEETLK